MTALSKYQRLEGPGLWRAEPQDQRRDVVVALGKASLTLTEARSGAVLSHWSLPAVHRLNPGQRPALYAPDPGEKSETLELEDGTLIAALETIHAALTPHRGGQILRRVLAVAGVALVAGFALFWLPGALVNHTAGIVPPAKRAQIGREALEDLTAPGTAVRLCAEPAARQAMATLRSRVLGVSSRVAVVDGIPGLQAGHLPGGLVVLGNELLQRLDGPEALAGYLLAEEMAAQADDPLRALLRHAGTRAVFALLTTGNLPNGAVAGHAARRLTQPIAQPDPAELAARLAALGISPAAYALSLPPAAAALAEALADQTVGLGLSGRVLSDGEWLTLQAICDG